MLVLHDRPARLQLFNVVFVHVSEVAVFWSPPRSSSLWLESACFIWLAECHTVYPSSVREGLYHFRWRQFPPKLLLCQHFFFFFHACNPHWSQPSGILLELWFSFTCEFRGKTRQFRLLPPPAHDVSRLTKPIWHAHISTLRFPSVQLLLPGSLGVSRRPHPLWKTIVSSLLS